MRIMMMKIYQYEGGDDRNDDEDGDLHVTVLLLEHGALPLGRQQEGEEPRHGKADHHYVDVEHHYRGQDHDGDRDGEDEDDKDNLDESGDRK